MQFIQKNSAEAEVLVANFIDGQWIAGSYVNLNYPGFNTNSMRKHLLGEQSNLCCYCMKELKEDRTTTIEHIIPQAVDTQAKMEEYFSYNVLRNNVTLHEPFRRSVTQQPLPPYPHHLAYQNLVASCNGVLIDDLSEVDSKTCRTCNGVRGNDLIDPLFYDPQVADKTRYAKGGILVVPDEWMDTITSAKLNDNALENIRKIWYCLRTEDLATIISASTEEERKLLLVIALSELRAGVSEQLVATYTNLTLWDSLMKYKWFHGYYKSNHAVVA